MGEAIDEIEEIKIDLPEQYPKQFSRAIWNETLDSLRQFINPSLLFPQLVKNDILTLDQQTEFQDKTTFIGQRDLILTAIPSSDHDDFLIRFIRCLRNTSHENRGHSDLITILTQAIEAKRGVFVCPEESKKTAVSIVTHPPTTPGPPVSHGPTQLHIEDKRETKGFFRRSCSKCWITLYCMAVAVPILAGTVTIIVLSQTPSTKTSSISTRYTHDSTTISLDFGISPKWIDSFTLSMDTCTGKVMVVQGSTCEQLPVTTRFVPKNESALSPAINLYLLPGSFLNITARRSAMKTFILQSIETYLEYAHQGESMALFECGIPQKNIRCFSNENGLQLPVFTVTKADFYSVVSITLPFQFDLSYLSVSYDMRKIQENFNVREHIVGSSELGTVIKVSERFLDLQDKCVLLLADCSSAVSRAINYQSISRRQDILLIPSVISITLGLFCVVLISFVHILCIRRKVLSK